MMSPSKLLAACSLAVLAGLAASQGTVQTLTQTQMDNIVGQHNVFRNQVKPLATNMQALQWSSTLATVAANYGAQCIWAHNANRTSQQSTFGYVGENIYILASQSVPSTSGSDAVVSWNSENASYTYQSSCSNTGAVCGNCTGSQCGHYTQNVWATTQYVGCAVISCSAMQNNVPFTCSTYGVCTFVVCDYGEGGNYVDQAPYTTGTTAASQCSTGTSQVSGTNLCSSTGSVMFGTLSVSTGSGSTGGGSVTAPANSSTTTKSTSSAVGAVLGSIAAVAVVAAAVAGFLYYKKRKNTTADGYIAH